MYRLGQVSFFFNRIGTFTDAIFNFLHRMMLPFWQFSHSCCCENCDIINEMYSNEYQKLLYFYYNII